ncbi:hypothetical protein BCON_0320g00040 [Botryotinia convoluta]|uniref:Uncharacterized protein n=1 Tax=Botryotinia convoluta TaxID=54673 RepID=A0A4Z1HBS0_9HELO|nr:hypothetical protein BCON_0320g00040 [Botryotinia convoluta]
MTRWRSIHKPDFLEFKIMVLDSILALVLEIPGLLFQMGTMGAYGTGILDRHSKGPPPLDVSVEDERASQSDLQRANPRTKLLI